MTDLALNLFILGFCKYQGFLAESINRALGEEFIAELGLALPVGISFFMLQAIAYVVDVYRARYGRRETRPISACTSPCSRSWWQAPLFATLTSRPR